MGGFWDNFSSNFLANILSDILLAILLFYIFTQPGEKKKRHEAVRKSLGLLKSEIKVNFNRATSYQAALENPTESIVALFPLRYTRGAWNALKETDFFSNLQDPHLTYFLFRMNEATLVANKNLRKLQLAYLDEAEDDLRLLIETTKKECRLLVSLLENVLQMLRDIELPDFVTQDPFEADSAVAEEEDRRPRRTKKRQISRKQRRPGI